MKSSVKHILITGGAGFAGSNLAILFKQAYSNVAITALDNLKRRGSELNLTRLRQNNIAFIHGDIRNPEDFVGIKPFDLLIECSAEPSVLAGYDNPQYLLNTNLSGTINCLELARKFKADIVFLSTSRVYPIAAINNLNYNETDTRFVISDGQTIPGASSKGISEDFPLFAAPRSLYGASKLASELVAIEYAEAFGLNVLINRCGILTGTWQMGKVDQGVVVLWLVNHFLEKPLSYIGFGGKGKQVRDFLHIRDLFALLDLQLDTPEKFSARPYNVGGGQENTFSLCELTEACRLVTGKKISISSDPQTRRSDIKNYITDCSRIKNIIEWSPKIGLDETLDEIYNWIVSNISTLKPIFG
jgi:CDP-paratose 2-epimerase